MIQRWDLVPECGGTSTLTRGATIAARWLHEPQKISNHSVGLGFPHRVGRYGPVGSPFSSPDIRYVNIRKDFYSGDAAGPRRWPEAVSYTHLTLPTKA